MTDYSNLNTEELPLVASKTDANEAIGICIAFVALVICAAISNSLGIL